ncbi:MAG: hypothetical protein H8E45_12920 [Proteobacteria bacterium]|nr:hypothetical protein [Pseudomonadota bacterium]
MGLKQEWVNEVVGSFTEEYGAEQVEEWHQRGWRMVERHARYFAYKQIETWSWVKASELAGQGNCDPGSDCAQVVTQSVLDTVEKKYGPYRERPRFAPRRAPELDLHTAGCCSEDRDWLDGLDIDVPKRMPRGAGCVAGAEVNGMVCSFTNFYLSTNRGRSHWVLWWESENWDYGPPLLRSPFAVCRKKGVSRYLAEAYFLRLALRSLDWGPGDWDLGLDADDNAALKREVWPEHGWEDDDEPLYAEDKPAEPLKLVAEPVKIAAGLKRCDECGEYRGETLGRELSGAGRLPGEVVTASCLCDGIDCRGCGKRTFRPISGHYYPLENHVSHVLTWLVCVNT